jgi:hypothetical protein
MQFESADGKPEAVKDEGRAPVPAAAIDRAGARTYLCTAILTATRESDVATNKCRAASPPVRQLNMSTSPSAERAA